MKIGFEIGLKYNQKVAKGLDYENKRRIKRFSETSTIIFKLIPITLALTLFHKMN